MSGPPFSLQLHCTTLWCGATIDEETSKIFGKERGRLRAAGLMIGDCDLLIGATALRHNLTLLTNNRRHFERIEGLHMKSV
jgi:tRNA(fMet)-specific endonuclease VapC